MSEEEQAPVKTEEEAPTPKPRMGIYDLLQNLRGGKVDPLTALMLMSELRRMERDEERWELERQQMRNPQPQQAQFNVKELVTDLNNMWENRFKDYTHRIESLLLGKKVEETEKRALKAEEKLKETEEKIEHEKLVEQKVIEATSPLQERIKELQEILAEKTAGMTAEQKKSVFQSLGERIEQGIGNEVADNIAKTVTTAIMTAFTPKEEVPVTKEGKFDFGKALAKWINKGLDVAKTYAEKMPTRPPPMQPMKQMPPLTPEQKQAIQQRLTQLAQQEKPSEPLKPEPLKPKIKEVPPPEKKEAPPKLVKKTKLKTKKTAKTEKAHAKPSAKTTKKSSGKQKT